MGASNGINFFSSEGKPLNFQKSQDGLVLKKWLRTQISANPRDKKIQKHSGYQEKKTKLYRNNKFILLYSHDQLYKHIYMQNHNNDTIKTSDTVL